MRHLGMAAAVLLAGCIDGTSDVGPLEALCDEIFVCYEFLDSVECQDEWFATNDPKLACDSEPAYLNCMDSCIGMGCTTAFDACELDCWDTNCGKVAR